MGTAEVSRAGGAQAAQQGSLCREQTASAEIPWAVCSENDSLLTSHEQTGQQDCQPPNKGAFFSSVDTHLGAAF